MDVASSLSWKHNPLKGPHQMHYTIVSLCVCVLLWFQLAYPRKASTHSDLELEDDWASFTILGLPAARRFRGFPENNTPQQQTTFLAW